MKPTLIIIQPKMIAAILAWVYRTYQMPNTYGIVGGYIKVIAPTQYPELIGGKEGNNP